MKIGIIGTGAYAIAISSLLENKNYDITMWTKIESEFQNLVKTHKNENALNYVLDNKIKFTKELKEFENKDYLILVIPTKFIKETIQEFKPFYRNQEILIASKGMIEDNNIFIHEYLEKELNTNKISCLSGPSFANDIILKTPFGLTFTSKNYNSLNKWINIFSDISYLTIDKTDDILGVEICGVLKNIIAIAAGILNGMNCTPSTTIKFLVDASRDIQDLLEKLNVKKESFYTYSGIGDFLLTATSKLSRNYTLGNLIGEDKDITNYIKNTTVEGLDNLKEMKKVLEVKNIKFPIIDILYEIIYNSKEKTLLLKYLYK